MHTALEEALCAQHAERMALGSLSARAAVTTAWEAAAADLDSLGVLAAMPAMQQWITVHGLDAMLVDALARSPCLRTMLDDSEPLSYSTRWAVDLLRSRLRWPQAARLLAGLGQASSLDVSTSSVLALMRCLFRGAASNERYACSAA